MQDQRKYVMIIVLKYKVLIIIRIIYMAELNIDQLRKSFLSGNILWSDHIHRRFQERGTTRDDVRNVLLNGKIIEQYPNDYPHPSCLISGTAMNGIPLHIVVAYKDDFITMVTAYYPDLDNFEKDLTTRKENKQ